MKPAVNTSRSKNPSSRKTNPVMRGLCIAFVCAMPLGLVTACDDTASQSPASHPPTASGTSASRTPQAPGPGAREKLTQPDVGDLKVAPDSARVDLDVPSFTNSAHVTNPLFPVSAQESVLLLGRVDGKDFRTEVTLLDHRRVVPWLGQEVEVLVSQYVAFLDGRIHEVAYDLYAQDDEGNVWYFGEDVFNFAGGAIGDTHGTWIAGVDGPAAMIMPAAPKPGDVYRPENIPGLVFEEVTVKAVDRSFKGPFGPERGALLVSELHMDGTTEAKTFAPGYGEFHTGGSGDIEALALAIPADAASGPLPPVVSDLGRHAVAAYDAARRGDWAEARQALDRSTAAWRALDQADVPRLVRPVLRRSLERLDAAVSSRQRLGAAQAAIDVTRSALDLRLRYEPAEQVDLARFDLWLTQMVLDATSDDVAAVRGDFFALDYIRDRIRPHLHDQTNARLDAGLEELLDAINDGNLTAVTQVAGNLRNQARARVR